MAAAQTVPTYGIATGKSEEPIVKELVLKYQLENIVWPIVLSQNSSTKTYLYERNSKNIINNIDDVRPKSKSGISETFMNYASNPRIIAPYRNELSEFIDMRYSCSYDYITTSPFSTVDLDYVWHTPAGWKGFELTTFYVEFNNKDRAANLVSKINRRPSWRGPNGAHALYKVVEASSDLSIDYYMVCVNTVSKVGSDIKTDGNVFYFPLTNSQIERLSKGLPPSDAEFCAFDDFLEWL